MNKRKVYTAVGLMSGTSLDGIDAALIESDGEGIINRIEALSLPYDDDMQGQLRACLGKKEDKDGTIKSAETAMTQKHAEAVEHLLKKAGKKSSDIDIIGFHGQTIHHDPGNEFTWQIGDGPQLAKNTNIDVVNNFRLHDILAEGEGAPLLPVYHQALANRDGISLPACILNIGGVGNLTFIGVDGTLLAFDTGPGNALIDDWIKSKTDADFDKDGKRAASGTPDQSRIDQWLSHDYFNYLPPKSLDRDEWNDCDVGDLSMEDGTATLAQFTIQSIARSFSYCPRPPTACYVTGGGRHNNYIMQGLDKALSFDIKNIDDLGWNGDSIEAEGFAYMAIRHILNLPISFPGTTGCKNPVVGGVLSKA